MHSSHLVGGPQLGRSITPYRQLGYWQKEVYLVKISIRKWGGDDKYSWAVFVEGRTEPVVAGLTRDEAQYHKKVIAAQLADEGQIH
jgi:hypothetical protein